MYLVVQYTKHNISTVAGLINEVIEGSHIELRVNSMQKKLHVPLVTLGTYCFICGSENSINNCIVLYVGVSSYH